MSGAARPKHRRRKRSGQFLGTFAGHDLYAEKHRPHYLWLTAVDGDSPRQSKATGHPGVGDPHLEEAGRLARSLGMVITCIYCKRERLESKEHVVPRALGGEATITCVCSGCNGGPLSKIDQALAERSLVSLSRAASTPPEAFSTRVDGSHTKYDSELDLNVEIALKNALRPVVRPQVHARRREADEPGEAGSVEIVSLCETPSDLGMIDEYVSSQIGAAGGFPTRTISDQEFCDTPRLLVFKDRRGAKGVIRAASNEDADLLARALRKGWAEYKAKIAGGGYRERTSEGPVEVAIRQRLIPDEENRAVGKIVMNCLALHTGARGVLGVELDAFRDYIIGADVRPEQRAPTDVACDPRFVAALPFGEPLMFRSDHHAVYFVQNGANLVAEITLYAKHHYIVTLGEASLPDPIPIAYEFSTDRTSHRKLGLEEIYDRMSARRGS